MDKIIDPNIAANAYTNSSGLGAGRRTATEKGPSFSDMMEVNARQAVDTLKKGEEMSAKAVTEEADITEVVQAVTAAEVTLQSVVAIRDRLIGAYQEIMRMPI